MIPVTKAFLPPQDEYQKILARAWDKKWITNRGELVLELEEHLKDYLKVNNIIITNNGTIPIQIALKLFGNGGEIITTPFSYVATTSSIVWENCKPVFVDIDPDYLTIDETKIEAAITNKTTAILATHVYGNPCHVNAIQDIAEKHQLKVIYDAAHCFGVKYKGESLFNYGDVSTCSFHATKIFQTGEGGAMFCNNKDIHHQLFYSHNFGHDGPLAFHGLGINGKISELQAAMGLAVFPYINKIMQRRKDICNLYNDQFKRASITRQKIRENTDYNYAYYPIILSDEETLLRVEEALLLQDVLARRYFFPSLNTLPYLNETKEFKISESISKRVLCLPLYYELTDNEVIKISDIVLNNLASTK